MAAGFSIDVLGDLKGFDLQSTTTKVADGVELLRLTLTSATPAQPPRSRSSGAFPPTTWPAIG